MTWTDKTAFTGEAAAFAGELHDKLAALPSLALSTLDSESTALFVVDMVEGFARQGAMASPRVEALIAPSPPWRGGARRRAFRSWPLQTRTRRTAWSFRPIPRTACAAPKRRGCAPEIAAAAPKHTVLEKNSTNGIPRAGDSIIWQAGSMRRQPPILVTGDCIRTSACCSLYSPPRRGTTPAICRADTGADGADGHLRRAGTPGRHAGGGSVVFDGGRRGGTIRRCRLIGHPFGTRKPVSLGS